MPVLRRSGSLDFPAPSLALRVAARAFEVFRRCHAGPWLLAKSRVPCGPSGLGSPSEHAAFQSGSALTDLLPWPRSRRAASNRRFSPSVRRRAPFPLSTDPAGRPLPQALPPASVAENPSPQSRSTLVVSHHLDGFLRPEVAGLLHPAASHEVRRVSCHRPSERGTARSAVLFGVGRAFPAARFTPLEELPPTAAVPHRCGRCPLAVPSFQLGFVARSRCRFQVSKLRGSERRLRGFPPLSGP